MRESDEDTVAYREPDGTLAFYAKYDGPESPEWTAAAEKVTQAMVGARIRALHPHGLAERFTDDAELALHCMDNCVLIWLEANEPLVREEMNREHQG